MDRYSLINIIHIHTCAQNLRTFTAFFIKCEKTLHLDLKSWYLFSICLFLLGIII